MSTEGDSDHQLAAFKLQAVIDWIELRVRLPSPSQPRHVRDRMPRHWCKPFALPEEGRASSSTFVFRVQDPGTPDEVLADVQALSLDGTPIGENDVEILALELALDAYPAHPPTDPVALTALLAEAALYLHRHRAHPPDQTARITLPGRYRAAAGTRNVLGALLAGHTINQGKKDADYRQRTYVKKHDTLSGGSYVPLARNEWRARTEVTLGGSLCPFGSVADWRAFRYETLMDRFAMLRHVAPKSVLVSLIREQQTQLGRARGTSDLTGPTKHKRKSPLGTRRDTDLNDRIRDALRAVTRRGHKRPKRTKIRDFSGVLHAVVKVGVDLEKHASSEGSETVGSLKSNAKNEVSAPAPEYLNTEGQDREDGNGLDDGLACGFDPVQWAPSDQAGEGGGGEGRKQGRD